MPPAPPAHAAPQGDAPARGIRRTWVVRTLFLCATLAALLDGVSTYVGIAHLGAVELNPVMDTAITALGLGATMTLRILAGVLVAWWSARVAVFGFGLGPWDPPDRLRWYRFGMDAGRWYALRARTSVAVLCTSAALTWGVVGNNLGVLVGS